MSKYMFLLLLANRVQKQVVPIQSVKKTLICMCGHEKCQIENTVENVNTRYFHNGLELDYLFVSVFFVTNVVTNTQYTTFQCVLN